MNCQQNSHTILSYSNSAEYQESEVWRQATNGEDSSMNDGFFREDYESEFIDTSEEEDYGNAFLKDYYSKESDDDQNNNSN